MPKYLKTKEGSLESAVLEAVSPAQQAAIAISKKKKAGKPGYDDEGKSLKDDMTAEDKEAYEKFFQAALKKFGVDSPADFKSDEEKKKFFNYVDKNYKGENEETDLDEKVKEYKGIAYFKDRKDAEAHMKKFAPKGRVVEYDRGYAVQTKISGPYLNKSGKTEEVQVNEETLAMRTAKHISDMWSEASKKGEVKSEEEDEDEKKEDGKTMTGKPISKVDTKVVEKD